VGLRTPCDGQLLDVAPPDPSRSNWLSGAEPRAYSCLAQSSGGASRSRGCGRALPQVSSQATSQSPYLPANFMTTDQPVHPPLERQFVELLAQLGLRLEGEATRSISRKHRISEEILAAFLEKSGKQLVDLLQGGHAIPVPLDQLEVIVSLLYGTLEDVYIGFDSHLPSSFLRVHPFLLENLAAAKPLVEAGSSAVTAHAECHAPQRVRIVPFSRDELQADLDDPDNHDAAREYFSRHDRLGITLLAVKRATHARIRADVFPGEWTSDLGLWANTCSVLFEQKAEAANKQLRLELIYPTEPRFGNCVMYIQRLIESASVVTLRGDNVEFTPLTEGAREHLYWSLETMFEPNLADVWDEFVDQEKRIDGLGPFVTQRITEMERAFEAAPGGVRILDAATGVGCESVYLLKAGHQVTSNEIEPRLIAHAVDSAARAGVELALTRFDWRHLERLADPEEFDVILALGNSLSCLASEEDVRIVLKRFAHLIRPRGLLIIDERNYPAIFKNRSKMRRPDYRFPGNVVYCSEVIKARPSHIPAKPGVDHDLLTLTYHREVDGISTVVGTFKVLPFGENQLEGLLDHAGFSNVKRYYNLREPNGNAETSEFVTYVATRGFAAAEVEQPSRPINVVVAFTDLLESTKAKKSLGEKRYAEEWRKHSDRVHSLVKARGGRIASSPGDGFLVAFTNASDAVDCMRELVADSGSASLIVRAGINAGEAYEDDEGNLRGHDVDIAARICEADAARPNNVLVDDQIKVDASEYEWESAGRIDLRGAGSRAVFRLVE
jgi:class 3 adenylate cyclase